MAFQSTRLSRASTALLPALPSALLISIHKALASLDYEPLRLYVCQKHFNPQGSREPRLIRKFGVFSPQQISIHKALASLDLRGVPGAECPNDFNPQGSREPRLYGSFGVLGYILNFNPQGSREPRPQLLKSA